MPTICDVSGFVACALVLVTFLPGKLSANGGGAAVRGLNCAPSDAGRSWTSVRVSSRPKWRHENGSGVPSD